MISFQAHDKFHIFSCEYMQVAMIWPLGADWHALDDVDAESVMPMRAILHCVEWRKRNIIRFAFGPRAELNF